MNKLLLMALLIFVAHPGVMAQDKDEFFSIYLVRHAEKEGNPADPGNPGLSACGVLRAHGLARILVDAKLEKIFSTDYERTLGTAHPVADALSLEIEIYDPGDLELTSGMLLKRQQNALVVGHSNTTPVLAGLLAGETLEPFEEHLYDRLYQVTVIGEHATITLLHQGFSCGN